MKGQAALEYLMIIGVLLIILIPLLYYTTNKSSEDIRRNEINDAIQTIARKADSIYALGEGSRDIITIKIPTGIEYTIVSNNTLLAHSSRFGTINSRTKGTVTGIIPKTPGTYRIQVEMQKNIVVIGLANATLQPEGEEEEEEEEECEQQPGPGFTYLIPDKAWYYKTPAGQGISTKDSQMNTLQEVTIDLTDEDKNTPPSSQKIYHTPVNDIYEGYILKLNKTKDIYNIVTIRLKVKDADQIPYTIRIYAYDSDGSEGDSILLTGYTQAQVTEIMQSGVNRGYNEFDITQTVKTGNSPLIKIRIAAESSIDKKTMHITEADFGVG